MNNLKLVILTTAITRPELHNKSIGKLYLNFDNSFSKLKKVYHIINIDYPDKLKELYNYEDTKNNFNKIIPSYVEKHFITEKGKNFCLAYKKVCSKLNELNILDNDTLVWWLEDDWYVNEKLYDFFNFFKLLELKHSAISFCKNAPIGSFRGGPIMSSSYFTKLFDLSKTININCDPEKKVGLFIFPYKDDRRVLENDESINIICLINDKNSGKHVNFRYSSPWHYKRKISENNKKISMNYDLILFKNYQEIYYFRLEDKYENFSYNDFIKKAELINFDEFKNKYNDISLKYFNIYPDIIFDIGRDFQEKLNLIKSKNSYK